MTPEQLQAIRERCEKTTPGPWAPYRNGEVDFFGSPDGAYMFDADSFEIEDAEFIAHAREDVPALLDEIERLRGAIVSAVENMEHELSGLGIGHIQTAFNELRQALEG